jgi:hypothetical protein
MPDNTVASQKAAYENMRQHELNGTGFADKDGPSWPAQQAAQQAATQRAASASAAEGARNRARQNYKQPTSSAPPAKPLPRAKKGK